MSGRISGFPLHMSFREIAFSSSQPASETSITSSSCPVPAMTTTQLNIRELCTMLHQPSTRAQAIDELQGTFNRLVEIFFPDPQAFSALLTDTGSVITGRAALWFMMRDAQAAKPTALTVTCPLHQFDAVYAFVRGLPGASVHPYPEDIYLSNDNRAHYFGVRQRTRVKTAMGLIELLESESHTAFHPIPFQYGTHMMNVLSPGHFISPHANLTLKRIAFTPPLFIRHHNSELPTVDSTHFRLVTYPFAVSDLGETCYSFPACCKRIRTFADEDCLVLSFSASPIEAYHDIPMDATCTAWRLGGEPCGNSRCFLGVERKVEAYKDKSSTGNEH